MTRRRRQLLNTAEDLRQPRDLDNIAHFEPRRETVGDLLRRAREGKGREIEAVAARLRIRAGYLKAIEDGRFQDLPGLTYAVGFVRTYADHLGLDAEDVVRRFRDEVTELKSQTQLVFPVVAAEGKMPRGAILLLSAVLAAIAYGGWYYLSEREQSALDLIPELPGKLRALVSGEEPAAPETAAETAPDAAPAVGDAAPADRPAIPGVTDPASPADETPTVVPPPAAPVADAAPEPTPIPAPAMPSDPDAERAAAASALPGAAAPSTSNVPPAAAPAGPPAAPSVAAPVPGTTTGTVAGATPTPAAPSLDASGLPSVAAPTPAAPATGTFASVAPSDDARGLPPLTDGQAFGATEAPSRIVLIARLESWVQVTDPQTNALLTRVLRAGDRYYVPDEAGLSLATGNAGGIDIWVDGRKAPALGPVGVVRRGVVLDPQRLANGTALGE